MQTFPIGKYIKYNRLNQHLTQEQLCEGLCEPATLSRLERGLQTPSNSLITALLYRLGLPDERFFALLSTNDDHIRQLKEEILSYNVMHNYRSGLEKLEELESLLDPDDLSSKQFALRSRAIVGKLRDGELQPYSPDEELNLLMQAIRLTVSDFDMENISDRLYGIDEIKIINQIALLYSDSGKISQALHLYDQLLEYVQQHFSKLYEPGGLLPLVAYNYARCLDMDRQYEKSIEIAEIGRQACVNYGVYRTLPGTLSIMAECCHFLGQEERSRDLYLQAYYLAKAIGHPSVEDTARREMKEYLGVEPEG